MRLLMLAFLGLTLAATPALASKRSGPAEGGRVAAKAANPAPAMKLRLVAYRPGQAGGPFKAGQYKTGQYKTAAASGAACAPRRCGGASHVAGVSGWAQGLPPAANIQANECPDGTMATLAHGHEDVVRCMPI